ncbi:nucleotide-binding universal stress UspA family protein [Amorphus suaedae]
MFKKLMLPIDLAHVASLEKALKAAVDLARLYDCPICLVGVTAEAATSVAHTPREYGEKLAAFGADLAAKQGVAVETASYAAHDPSIDLNKTLLTAVGETGSDLIVMASHVPGLPDHFFSSHGGAIASHAPVSVFVVR